MVLETLEEGNIGMTRLPGGRTTTDYTITRQPHLEFGRACYRATLATGEIRLFYGWDGRSVRFHAISWAKLAIIYGVDHANKVARDRGSSVCGNYNNPST
jgi:hypothetical protein